ncbi:MAG: methyl-accepting chemotaxis protein [Planctomycetota bacterium]
MFSKFFGNSGDSESVSKARALARVVDESDTAFMMVDRDFNVVYVNTASTQLFRKHQTAFASRLGSFDPENIIGTNFDCFHTDPNQRLSTIVQSSAKPVSIDIVLGETSLDLRVTQSVDQFGQHAGSTLEWKDNTEQKIQQKRDADFRSQVEAVDRSQARIEFALDRTVLYANQNFLNTMGYLRDEVIGKDHKQFVTSEFGKSPDYKALWDTVKSGEAVVGEFERVHKDGSPIWLQAAYAPVFDNEGAVTKIVKIASDITKQRHLQDAINILLDETKSVMQQVSDGDLTVRINGEYSDGLGDLKVAVNETLNELNQTIGAIYRVADTVGTGASEISSGNADLSQRTEQQASSLERTATSMTEMTTTVQQNATNASEANQLAIETREQAETGGEVAQRATNAMGEINAASKKISDIIGVIDEIAFQTNLLALNASVEAARAGDQGRGFAVVASEVRNLAGRSATAAKEIKDLIEDSSRKVEEGSRLVNQSGDTLRDIVERVQKVTQIVGSIAAASSEQSEGISQVNTAIGQMDDLTQQNAALVEEVAAASQSLNQEAANLSELVRKFTVSTSRSDVRAPAVSAPSASLPAPTQSESTAKKPFVERRSAERPWTPPVEPEIRSPMNDSAEPVDDEVWESF